MQDEFVTPNEVDEAARLAEELHAKMYTTEEPVSDEPIVEEPVVTEPVVEQPKADTPKEENFEEKYLHLKGKYDAEVPRLARELRELKEQIIKSTVIEDPKPDTPSLIDKLEEEYGSEFVGSLKELIASEAKKLVQPVADQTASLESTQIQTAQENFKSYLDTKVEGWRELWGSLETGTNPKFVEFLQSTDPSGLYTYADLVKLYNDNWDADKLATVFKTFLGEPVVKDEPVVVPPKPNAVKDALIAPSRQADNPQPTSSDKKIWTQADIGEFQRRDRQGDYSEEVSKALWDDLLAAMSDGRIKN
jgi:hypothetical protein